MLLLYLIALAAGMVAAISPCILPVLPVILVATTTTPVPVSVDPAPTATDPTGAAGGYRPGVSGRRALPRSSTGPTAAVAPPADGEPPPAPSSPGRRRAVAVIGGLVLSFGVFTLAGSELLSALHLPQDLLRDIGLVILGVVAASLLYPPLGELLERPFARMARFQPNGNRGAFVLGLGLGVLYAPCAGPVLTAITVVSAKHRVGWSSLFLTIDFAVGTAIPLLILALAGQRVAQRVRSLRTRAVLYRQLGGVVLAVMTLVLSFNWADGLQTAVPGYTTALQKAVEGGSYATQQLDAVKGTSSTGRLATCIEAAESGAGAGLTHCGQAPPLTEITAWLNTPGGRPVPLSSLRGKVVLVDFWTYSCINCQRSLPHVEAWYRRYHAVGLDVIGVEAPEFAFEHVVSNVASAALQLKVHYPIAVDDKLATFTAYQSESWPADYLIDATGQVRNVAIGEGNYGATETDIRQLLQSAEPGLRLPPRTDVSDRTPVNPTTQETYLGYSDLEGHDEFSLIANGQFSPAATAAYTFPATLPVNDFALAGTWTSNSEELTSGPSAKIELSFQADDVYLVLGGTGTLDVAVNRVRTKTIAVGGVPRLYTLVAGAYRAGTVTLTASPGIQAYDFTFG
ncbi:MAG: cytochrome c biogenesis protein CcdA [Acidimicrobiales bacterium]